MDCAPLNLAHFHERRADKFIRHSRFDDAHKAVKASLLYLQDAYNVCNIPKSLEVLDTQKWEYERKLRQIQICKQQHERLKLREIVPLSETNSVLLRPESSVTAQSVAKSIDKTIRDFDAKFSSTFGEQNMQLKQLSKENQEPQERSSFTADNNKGQCVGVSLNEKVVKQIPQENKCKNVIEQHSITDLEDDEMPSLAPLELPSFDFNMTSTLASIVGLAEGLQK